MARINISIEDGIVLRRQRRRTRFRVVLEGVETNHPVNVDWTVRRLSSYENPRIDIRLKSGILSFTEGSQVGWIRVPILLYPDNEGSSVVSFSVWLTACSNNAEIVKEETYCTLDHDDFNV